MENYKSYLEAENMIEMVKSQRADIMAQNRGFIYFTYLLSYFKRNKNTMTHKAEGNGVIHNNRTILGLKY